MYGDAQTLCTAHQLGLELTEHVVKGAARSGSIDKLKYLLEAGLPITLSASSAAAEWGQLTTLQWLRAQGLEWDNCEICGKAAMSGDMDVLLYTEEMGGVLSARTMAYAAEAGKLHMCQYLRTQQCPWDERATNYSAFAGRVDVLGWLLQHGCPVVLDKEGLLSAAAFGGSTDVLQCLLDASLLTLPSQFTEMLHWAGEFSNLAAAQWLREHGAEWPVVLCNDYDEPWPDTAVAWARSEGCTAPTASV
jgi:hypothetical protein